MRVLDMVLNKKSEIGYKYGRIGSLKHINPLDTLHLLVYVILITTTSSRS